MSVPGSTAQGDGFVFAAYHDHGLGKRQTILRFDPRTRTMRRSPPVAGWKPVGWDSRSALALSDGALWIATGRAGVGRSSDALLEMSPTALRITRTIHMPRPPTSVVATASGLWVAAGDRLYAVDPVTARVVKTVDVPGSIRLLAADPAGRRVYVSTTRKVGYDGNLLAEYNGATGALLARGSAGVHELNGPSGMVATDAGVWVTFPTGNMGSLTFLRSSDLRVRQAPEGWGVGTNGMQIYLAGNTLWKTDATHVACLSPITGRTRHDIKMREGGIPFSIGDSVYLWSSRGLAVIHKAAPSCL